jgi:hypothetical protein
MFGQQQLLLGLTLETFKDQVELLVKRDRLVLKELLDLQVRKA